ncbi:MAG TPA: hypothetical protein DCE48_13645 [Lachnospiraceae bacterium]|uniref:hypothetical protein n=1 Tax=Anaerosporobacter sp. TaxID=1872529 RepID=UPI000EEF6047|nr:hypothetical protein [Anaerosporobacter sp.]HAB61713.1 hypothetical protein [Lachnospiraceae bacterium]
MLDVKQRTIQVIEVEEGYIFEIHELPVDKDTVVEVWVYQKEYTTKIHAFSIMKSTISNPTKLYKHIEDNMQEYIDTYKEEVIEEIED